MKRLLPFIIFFLSLSGWSSSTVAQELTPDMAKQLKERSLAVHARIQETKGSMPAINGALLITSENKLLDEILPQIERLLLDAGDLFGKAAENLPGEFGQDCLRQGCKKLKEALQLVKDGKRLVRREGQLKPFAELLATIQEDIRSAVEDVGCRKAPHGGANPWRGKRFRSEYTSPNGQWVKGTTEIHGENGSYRSSAGQQGSLHGIRYRDNGTVAEGYWRFNHGGTGWFSFTLSADGRSFHGSWGDGNHIGQHQKGSWKGHI
jgi:hypothetical protein